MVCDLWTLFWMVDNGNKVIVGKEMASGDSVLSRPRKEQPWRLVMNARHLQMLTLESATPTQSQI